MRFLEKDLEEIIFNSDYEDLRNVGLIMPKFKKRQVKLGEHGRADIMGLDFKTYNYEDQDPVIVPTFSVFELKQDKISVSAFMQAIGYAHALRKFLNKRSEFYYFSKIKIVLIGNKVDDFSSLIHLPRLVNSNVFSLEIYTYEYSVTGIKFKAHHPSLTNFI